jgi:hypothetical protein
MRIITGCSRSGTSFICQVLAELGGDFGADGDLVEADEWNKRGYFENKAVNTLNHRLLFGGSSDPTLWIDVMWPKDWRVRLRKLSTIALSPVLTRDPLIERRAGAMSSELKAASLRNLGRCVKDPRFCYLMRPWMRHGEVTSVLFVVRHPAESAGSMSRQTGLPRVATMQGWLDSVRRFWDELPDVLVSVVDYNAFFDAERAVNAARPLFEFLGLPFDADLAGEVLDATLDPALRTRRAPDAALPRAIDERYQELLQRAGSLG